MRHSSCLTLTCQSPWEQPPGLAEVSAASRPEQGPATLGCENRVSVGTSALQRISGHPLHGWPESSLQHPFSSARAVLATRGSALCKQGTPFWRCCPLPALGVLCDGEGRPRWDGGEGLLLHADISEWAGEAQAVCLESLLGGCGSALRNGVMHLGGAEPGVLGAGFYSRLCHALCLVPVSEPQSSHL